VRAVPSPGSLVRSPGRRRAAAALVHLVIAIAATAPLAWRTGLPLGREPTPTVPRFNLWTLRWTADRLPHGLAGWWDAPIFAPNHGTFAWSEPQPLTGVAFAAARAVVGDERGYAVVLIVTLALNGIAGAALARRLGASRRAALLAGILVQTVPFTWDQLGVVQLLALWPILAGMAATVAWAETGRARHAVAIGAAAAAGIATCGTLSFLGLLATAPATLVLVRRRWWRDPARWLGVGLAVATPMLLVGPVLVAQQQARLDGFRWRSETILAGSARPGDWIGGRTGPGLVLLALGLAGLWCWRRQRAAWFVAAAALIATVAALGLRLRVGSAEPWAFAVDHLDAFARLRSPYRATAIAQVALAVLSAGVLDRLLRRPPGPRRAPTGTVAAVALVAVGVLAARPGPGPIERAAREPGAWRPALIAAHDGADGAVAFLPFAPDTSTAAFAPTTERMLQAEGTGVAMVNGYSGFFPPDHARLRADLRGFPDERSLATLRAHGARWVVVDAPGWDRIDRRIAAELGIETLTEDLDGVLLELPRA